MARHSHWHNIQMTKGKSDAKRAVVFSKYSKNITLAAKTGGADPSYNFALRIAMDAARAVNMPKDKIEAAVARGTGGGDASALEEVVYECFAPGGVAMLVQCLTDNRNRTVADIRNVVTKFGGTVGGSGSVMWMFEKKGVVTVADAAAISDRDAFELAVIDAGAEDIQEDGGGLRILCAVGAFQKVAEAVESSGAKADGVALEYIAKDLVDVADAEAKQQLDALCEALEDNDDVDNVFTNEK